LTAVFSVYSAGQLQKYRTSSASCWTALTSAQDLHWEYYWPSVTDWKWRYARHFIAVMNFTYSMTQCMR